MRLDTPCPDHRDAACRLVSADPRALHEAALRRLAEVQLALRVVVGDTTALVVEPDRYERVIVIRWHGESSFFGLDVDAPAPEPDEPTQFERDVDVIADELSESRAFWGRRLPECPLHPDSHALLIDIGPDAATVRCSVSGETIRTVPRLVTRTPACGEPATPIRALP